MKWGLDESTVRRMANCSDILMYSDREREFKVWMIGKSSMILDTVEVI